MEIFIGKNLGEDDAASFKPIVLAAVGSDSAAMRYAPKNMQNDKEFVYRALISNPRTLRFASEEE